MREVALVKYQGNRCFEMSYPTTVPQEDERRGVVRKPAAQGEATSMDEVALAPPSFKRQRMEQD